MKKKERIHVFCERDKSEKQFRVSIGLDAVKEEIMITRDLEI